MTRLIDCHSHCALSGHGEGTVKDMVLRARDLGLHTYCMTEHMGVPESMDPKCEDHVPESQIAQYCLDVLMLREDLKREGSDMSLVLGAEIDWLGDVNKAMLPKFMEQFEYTLGSIHFLEGKAVDNSDDMTLWETYGVDGVWEKYVDEWLRMATSGLPFSAFSHLDLPKVFGQRPSFDIREAYAAMGDALKAADVPFEINAAGWLKKADEQYPAEECIRMLLQRKIPVTVGCDAHKPANVAVGADRAYDLLRRLGAEYVVVPTPRTARDGEWAKLEL